MSHSPLFTGCAVALITPFHENEVDYSALEKLIDFQLENRTDALVVCGTTGEPSVMTEAEWQAVIAFAVRRVAGRVPVIAGTGGNCTADVIRKARLARELGADGQLCVTPYYNKTTQPGLIAHYSAIADDGALPMILYNVPSRTGLNLQSATLAALADHEMIVGMKEASGDMVQIMEELRLCGDKIAFYAGSDELTAPMMAMGGQGVISVAANIAPALMRQMTHAPLPQAAQLNLRLLPLIRALFAEVNPIPVKSAAAMLGLCENRVRLPLVEMTAENQQKLKAEMERIGLLC